MVAQLGVPGSAPPVHLDPTGEHGGARASTTSREDVFASSAAGVETLLASTFSSPEEALRFVPQLIAGLAGSSRGPTADEGHKPTTAETGSVDSKAPQDEVLATTLRTAGVDARDFEQAFTAALEEELPEAAHTIPGGRELFAVAAAGASVVPGGAAAVARYIARNNNDPEVRRWGARVRALVGACRSAPRRQPLRVPRRSTARRVRRSRSRHRVRRLSRAGPHDGPAPSESDSPNARATAQGGVP